MFTELYHLVFAFVSFYLHMNLKLRWFLCSKNDLNLDPDLIYRPQDHQGKNCIHTVELQWLENLWNLENMFGTEVIRANEC